MIWQAQQKRVNATAEVSNLGAKHKAEAFKWRNIGKMKTGFSFSRYFIVSLKIGSFTIDDGNANQASQINNLIVREKKNKRVARAARTLEQFSAHLWF